MRSSSSVVPIFFFISVHLGNILVHNTEEIKNDF